MAAYNPFMAKKKKRVELKKNRSKPARDKGWTRGFQQHGYSEEATLNSERVRTKGDLSRKPCRVRVARLTTLALRGAVAYPLRTHSPSRDRLPTPSNPRTSRPSSIAI